MEWIKEGMGGTNRGADTGWAGVSDGEWRTGTGTDNKTMNRAKRLEAKKNPS